MIRGNFIFPDLYLAQEKIVDQLKIPPLIILTFSGLFGGKLAIMHHIATFKVQRFTLSVNSQEHKMLDLMLKHLENVR
jgi:hypothetical protein